MRVTIRQIAEASGLSIQTVSQILNGKAGAFRAETCERVLRSANELGYRPNSSARAMRSGRFGAVSLLLSTHHERSLLPSRLLDGLLDATTANNLNLTVARLPDETLISPDGLPKALRELSSDGLLIKYDAGIPPAMISLIERSGLPAIWINSQHAHDCVYPDDYAAARRATEILLAQGHRRVAYLDWLRAGHYSRDDRLRGYTDAMRSATLEPRDLWPTYELRDAETIRRTFSWLAAPDRPTALLTYHGEMAQAVYHAALVLGLRIPQDFSLLAFSDTAHNPLGPDIAIMCIPQREIGQAAVEMLLEKLRNPDVCLPPRPIPLVWEAGATTVSCPAD